MEFRHFYELVASMQLDCSLKFGLQFKIWAPTSFSGLKSRALGVKETDSIKTSQSEQETCTGGEMIFI